MTKYISVSEAKTLTGKAEATIRKVFKNAEESGKEDLLIKEPYKGGFKLWILKSYLLETLKLDTKNLNKKNTDSNYITHLEEEIQFLRERIKNLEGEKDADRKRQDYLIKLLGEKISEDEKYRKLK